MEIRVYRSNADLPDHLRGQILALIRIHWHDVAGDYVGPQALPEEWHPAHVVGTEGDVILSYAGVVWRHIDYRGEVLKVYGLSTVYTFPSHRRAGLGSRIVRRATAEIEQAGDADIGLLFTLPELEPFYRRAGWQAMTGLSCLVGDPARPAMHDALAMMLFLSAKARRLQPSLAQAQLYVGEYPW